MATVNLITKQALTLIPHRLLKDILKGCVILNSSPVLWLEEAVAYSKQFDLPDLTEDMQAFIQNPMKNFSCTCIPTVFLFSSLPNNSRS